MGVLVIETPQSSLPAYPLPQEQKERPQEDLQRRDPWLTKKSALTQTMFSALTLDS
jgi:hypothetical protein